jgi:hypothetical protein
MKQYQAVISALENLGGQATLALLYHHTMQIPGVKWGTKTPFASIRRIVQVRPEIFKVRPGLWALESYRQTLGLPEPRGKREESQGTNEASHSYYQGLLTMIGNLRGFSTFVPNQDKNHLCLRRSLAELRSLQELPEFSYPELTRRVGTVDVTWFNERHMPHSLFEVEHSTDIQNSLLKFSELQDFSARMVIVASAARKREYQAKSQHRAFKEIAERVAFYDYESLARDYEHEAVRSSEGFSL